MIDPIQKFSNQTASINPGVVPSTTANTPAAQLAQSLGYQSVPSPGVQEQGLKELANLAKEDPASVLKGLTAEQISQLLNAPRPNLQELNNPRANNAPTQVNPFGILMTTLEKYLGPVATTFGNLFEQLFGLHIGASKAGVTAYGENVEANKPQIRELLAQAFAKVAESANSLNAAAQAGQLDLPMGELAKVFNAGLDELKTELMAANGINSSAPKASRVIPDPSLN